MLHFKPRDFYKYHGKKYNQLNSYIICSVYEINKDCHSDKQEASIYNKISSMFMIPLHHIN